MTASTSLQAAPGSYAFGTRRVGRRGGFTSSAGSGSTSEFRRVRVRRSALTGAEAASTCSGPPLGAAAVEVGAGSRWLRSATRTSVVIALAAMAAAVPTILRSVRNAFASNAFPAGLDWSTRWTWTARTTALTAKRTTRRIRRNMSSMVVLSPYPSRRGTTGPMSDQRARSAVRHRRQISVRPALELPWSLVENA